MGRKQVPPSGQDKAVVKSLDWRANQRCEHEKQSGNRGTTVQFLSGSGAAASVWPLSHSTTS